MAAGSWKSRLTQSAVKNAKGLISEQALSTGAAGCPLAQATLQQWRLLKTLNPKYSSMHVIGL